jgi:hypothetical protein
MTLRLNGTTSGYVEIDSAATSGNHTIVLPSSNGSANQLLKNGSTAGALEFASNVAIDSSGRLLVGTSTSMTVSNGQFAKLQMVGNSFNANNDAIIAIGRGEAATAITDGEGLGKIAFTDNAGGVFCEINGVADGTAAANDYPGRLVFGTTADGASTPTERMRITSTGAILAGYASAGVNASGVINAVGYAHKQGTGAAPGSSAFNFFWTGSLQAWIDTSNVGNVTLTSDYRIKKNIETQTSPAIPRLKQLRPVTYERANYGTLFTEDGVVREGFIAHELAEIVPSAVEGEKDAENQIQSINIDALVSVLTKALQEAVEKIETLEAANAALETRLAALEAQQ